MADRYLIETSAVDGYLLEDGTGVLILEQQPGADDLATKQIFLPSPALPLGMLMISGG